jgi:predicted pyridoxine 5'-phosphate oxidase superfamily flavin-nucleotide-binding protein
MTSQFHAGEQTIQHHFGMRERMAGVKAIRPFMAGDHRDFFTELSYIVVGAPDPAGQLWASVLFGDPGFITAPDPRLLRIGALPAAGDPLAGTLAAGTPIAVLGIELATRRRNRAAGRIAEAPDEGAIAIAIEQCYGNCPQYIWPRAAGPAAAEAPAPLVAEDVAIDDGRVARMVGAADTFFIASQYRDPDGGERGGVDVSHRGGEAGFMAVTDGAIVWPEYRGNFFFNTLGNLHLNPAAGLLIPDFATGDLLQLTGRVELLWPRGGTHRAEGMPATNCLVRFRPERIVLRAGAMPAAWRLLGGARYFQG